MSEVEIYQEKTDPHQDDETGTRGWRWRVKAANGEIVASGESYTTRGDAIRGFGNARNAMMSATIEEVVW